MPRKKWIAKENPAPEELRSREKRKWQIALRRYVLNANPSLQYAPYFGLDAVNMRRWFEIQFTSSMNWENFGQEWQFEHFVPLSVFDSSLEEEIRICWHFSNLRPGSTRKENVPFNPSQAEMHFRQLFKQTGYHPFGRLVTKLEQLMSRQATNVQPIQTFIIENRAYLDSISHYSPLEFELLNNGRTTEQIARELEILKKF